MANHSTIRISKEITNIQKGTDLSIAVAFRDENIRKVRALIVGPPDTPYEFGFFEFRICFPKEYPEKPPDVKCITTNGGKTRFNPNIYACGKVCLSILGTWRGEPGEEWSSAQGLESILISIQSLMSANPYENEPGFELQRADSEKLMAKLYAAKIKHETIRVSVVDRLERLLRITNLDLLPQGLTAKRNVDSQGTSNHPSLDDAAEGDIVFDTDASDSIDFAEPFSDLCKRRFLWYYESYVSTIAAELQKYPNDVKDGFAFSLTRFEAGGNEMKGKYRYSDLLTRLDRIRKAINLETQAWADKAMEAKKRESPLTLNFDNKFKHIVHDYKQRGSPTDFEMVDGNPCVWRLTIFGRPMTNLDGGIFRVRMNFSLDFPDSAQPRVTVETPIFHSRVSTDGVLCYFPQNTDDLSSHVDAIIDAIENENPPYDPRTLVNAEAAKLCWGSADDKRAYTRKLRRSAQDSLDFADSEYKSLVLFVIAC